MSEQTANTAVPVPQALPPGYRKPAHGAGMLRAPWKPGERGNPTGRIGEFQRTVGLARQTSMRAMETIISKLDSDDDRVALVAAQAILERAWGKPKDPDPKELQQSGLRLDFTKLSREELQLLLKITHSGAIKPAEDVAPETIDGTATSESG